MRCVQSANDIHTFETEGLTYMHIYNWSHQLPFISFSRFFCAFCKNCGLLAFCFIYLFSSIVGVCVCILSLFLLSTCRFYIQESDILHYTHLCLCRRWIFSSFFFFCSARLFCALLFNALLKNCYSDKTISSKLTSNSNTHHAKDEKTKSNELQWWTSSANVEGWIYIHL